MRWGYYSSRPPLYTLLPNWIQVANCRTVYRGATDKRTIIENYDLVSLAIDEIIDDGIILETDPVLIASRVSRAPTADTPNMKNIDLSEQGLLNAWEFGRRKLAEQLRQGL